MVESTVTLEQFPSKLFDTPGNSGCGSCGDGKSSARCGNGLEKIYPTTAVRFGFMKFIGEFTHAPDLKFTCGAKIVIQTRRGIEIGEQVSLSCGGCDKSVTREQMKKWVASCGEDTYHFNAGRILREATASDLAEQARMQRDVCDQLATARRLVAKHDLPIKIVECEGTFGGERLIFFFRAEERVDFRGMVKDLAQEFRTRIEMRQVGARDEARLLADFETCGREVCCKIFLKTLKPISMKMAKLQKATLDPSKVSGRCGRLKCCLRYEHVGYEELEKTLPRMGKHIYTHHGEGVVVKRQILTQLVQIRTEDDTFVTVVVEDIVERADQMRLATPVQQAPQRPSDGDVRPDQGPQRRRRGGGGGRGRDSNAAPPAKASGGAADPAGKGAREAGGAGPGAQSEQPPPRSDQGEAAPRPRRRRRGGRRGRQGSPRRADGADSGTSEQGPKPTGDG